MFFQSVTRRKTVFSRDFCCLSAIFVVSCNSSLTRFQNSVDWNMFSPFQMLENEGLNLSQKRRVLLHVNSGRGRLTDSCSRNSDEMVHKGQCPQAKSSLCHCSLCIQISVHSESVGFHLASERVPRILETKATDRTYLERKNPLFFFLLAACLILLLAQGVY